MQLTQAPLLGAPFTPTRHRQALARGKGSPCCSPKRWLSPPSNLCHPLGYLSGCVCPCLPGQSASPDPSLLPLLQRCISWDTRSWPDMTPALSTNSAPSSWEYLYFWQSTDHLFWLFCLLATALEFKLTGEHLSLLSLSSGAGCGNISPCLQFVPGREGSFCDRRSSVIYLGRSENFPQRICEIVSEWSVAQACDSKSLDNKLFKKASTRKASLKDYPALEST